MSHVFICIDVYVPVQVLNAAVEPRRYWPVVSDAQSVSLQVSIVGSVRVIHLLLHTERVGVDTVLLLVLALIVVGQMIVRKLTGVNRR